MQVTLQDFSFIEMPFLRPCTEVSRCFQACHVLKSPGAFKRAILEYLCQYLLLPFAIVKTSHLAACTDQARWGAEGTCRGNTF